MSTQRRLAVLTTLVAGSLAALACDGRHLADHDAPEVVKAVALYDAGEAGAAEPVLADYLETGLCHEGSLAISERVVKRADGSFDLGLVLFALAEAAGPPFGDEPREGPTPGKVPSAGADPAATNLRKGRVECGLRLLRRVAAERPLPLELRAEARYLEGNLAFLNGDYRAAVRAYDDALALEPARTDAGRAVARDAAHNRAVALRRLEDPSDSGPPDGSSPDATPPDASPPDGGDGGDAGGGDGGDGGGGGDAGGDGGGSSGSGRDASDDPPDAGGEGGTPPPEPEGADGGAPPPRGSDDERVLDMFEHAPTVQQEDAKKRALKRRTRSSQDK